VQAINCVNTAALVMLDVLAALDMVDYDGVHISPRPMSVHQFIYLRFVFWAGRACSDIGLAGPLYTVKCSDPIWPIWFLTRSDLAHCFYKIANQGLLE